MAAAGFSTYGWLFYCPHCKAKRHAKLAPEQHPETKQEYFDLVCLECASILVTMEREKLLDGLKKPSPPS